MAAEAQVIKEFLVSLGFKVDEAGAKKFRTGLGDTTKGALALGSAVVGVGIAIEKFVEQMTEGLSKLYYVSQRTGATVGGLKSTAAGFEAIGLKASQAQEATEDLGDMLRKPWFKQQLQGWGINVNQKTEDIANDAIHMLADRWKQGGAQRQLAENFAEQWMHINARDLATMVQNLPAADAMRDAVSLRQRESGVDLDASAKDAAEFQRQLKLINEDFGVLANEVLPHLMPEVHSLANDFEELLHAIIKSNAEMPKQTGFFKQLWQALSGQAITTVDTTENAAIKTGDAELDEYYRNHPDKRPGADRGAGNSSAELRMAARKIASNYGLDPAEFEAQIQVESGFNPDAKNKNSTAKGVAQFTDGTAASRGFTAGQDPLRDLAEAARLLHDLMEKNHLTQKQAEAWYYGGTSSGPTASTALGAQDYQRKIEQARLGAGAGAAGLTSGVAAGAAKTFAPQTTYNINVTGQDATNTATSVKSVVRLSNEELTRNGLSILSN